MICLSCSSYAGKGFMASTAQVSVNLNEIITVQKYNISFDYFLSHRYAIGISASHMNRDFAINDARPFSYFAQSSIDPNNKANFKGDEVYLRFYHRTKFFQNIVPMGLTLGFNLGFMKCSIEQTYQSKYAKYDDLYLFVEPFIKNTFAITPKLGLFCGVSAAFSVKDNPDYDRFQEAWSSPFRTFNSSVNHNYDFANKGGFFFGVLNLNYGITYLL